MKMEWSSLGTLVFLHPYQTWVTFDNQEMILKGLATGVQSSPLIHVDEVSHLLDFINGGFV